MHHTPSDKGQLSSSLKERLKRCGRYHASPPVAKQPETTNQLQRNLECDRHDPSQRSTEGAAKRLCTGLGVHKETPVESEHHTEGGTCKTISPESLSKPDNNDVRLDHDIFSESGLKKLPLNETPSFQRRKSEGLRIKGSKLLFESGDSISTDCKGDVNPLDSNKHLVDTHSLDSDKRGDVDTTVNSSNLSQTDSHGNVNRTNNHGNVKETDNPGNSDKTDKHGDVDETDNHDNGGRTLTTKSDMIKDLALKEEELRKLRMVKMYRSKNNLSELQTLIDKWRDISQQALQDLHEAMSEPKPSLTQLISHLGIDHQLVRFTTENDEEDFY